jgi:hypothetical protein
MGEAHRVQEVAAAVDDETQSLGAMRMAMAAAHATSTGLDEAVKKTISQVANLTGAELSAFGSIGDSATSLLGAIVDGYQARVDAGEQLTQAEVEQANKAIRETETAAIATAGIQAGVAAISAIASLQAAGTPPPIAVGLGIAEGVGLFAATAAGIRARRPPDFTWSGSGSGSGGGNAGSEANTGVMGDTDGDGLPDDNSKPQIDPGGDKGGQSSRSRDGGGGLTIRTLRITATSGGRPGKAERRGGAR